MTGQFLRVSRTRILSITLLTCLAAAPVAAAGKDKAFTIANYPVDATDTNAVTAKEKALAEGQKAAFRSLLKRIVPVTSYKQLTRLEAVNAANLVSGFSVRSEQNSSTEYIANLDFSFHADGVRSALQQQGIPFVEEQAPQVIIIPVTMHGTPAAPKPDTGPWKQAWKSLDLEHSVTPVALEDLKPVIHADTIGMLTSGDGSAMRILSGEYKNDLIVLAISETDTAAKKIVVTLVGQDAVGPINLKRHYKMQDGDVAYTSELAAVVALGVLEGRWKAIKTQRTGAVAAAPPVERPAWSADNNGTGQTVRFVAEYSTLAQWNEIRAQLLDTPGVEGLEIATVSARNADVTLSFPGGPAALANALGGRGLSLGDTGAGWTLRSTN